ncbi:MAG: NADP-dependent oxidoreductase, partial [Acidimicrobiales bacterium]
VLVEVRAAGVNPIDYKLYRGGPGADPSKLPMRLGFEVAGVVVEARDGALDGPLREGDEVIAYPVGGAYASALVTAAANVVHKPANIGFEEASGLMLAGVTAVHALHAVKAGPGDTLLVHGASGGVGLMVVQLAVKDGVQVIATASEANHQRLRELGAEPVSYGDGLLQRARSLAPGGADAAIDIAGTGEAIDTSLALVADRGRIATLVAFERAQATGIKALGGGPGADPGSDIRAAARLQLARLAGDGRLRVFLAATYPLAHAGAAHQALASGRAHGKVALVP